MPQYTRNLISVKKIVDNGGQAVLGDSPKIIAPDPTEIPRYSETQLSCGICLTQKAKRVNILKHVGTRASKEKEVVHADLLGPLEESIDGHRYAINFFDSFSRFGAVYFMKTRTEVTEKFKQFIADYQAPKTIVTDGAKEFTSEVFEEICRDKGVRHEISSPYTPGENGKSERLWITLMNTTRCLLSSAKMSKTFWTSALNHAMFVKNRCIHSNIDCTPFKLMVGYQPDIHDVRVFGSLAFAKC